MDMLGIFMRDAAYLLCAGGALALAGWIMARAKNRDAADTAQAAALALLACWGLLALGLGAGTAAASLALCLANLGWLWMLYRLFRQGDPDTGRSPVQPLVLALAFVELSQIALLLLEQSYAGLPEALETIGSLQVILRLLFCIGALVLAHNLYVRGSGAARQALGWPAAALAVLWLYDLNLATIDYLTDETPAVLVAFRGVAALIAVILLAIGAMRNDGDLRFRPSRTFAFQSFSLLIIGLYFVVMVLVAQALTLLDNEFGRVLQAACVALAGAIALVVLPSRRLRGWLRVKLSKHLFQHRYDYRAEWLRFTATMGRAGPSASPLRERVVQAVADITDSPRGLLLVPDEDGGLQLGARWRWEAIDVPADALQATGAAFFESSEFIVDLDDVREGRASEVPDAATPEWISAQQDIWAMVPLLHYERLIGLIVLHRPIGTRHLDWEDLDLLRIVGRQLASYLAEQASQDALGEAQRFDEFNRRIAFVMHDIKNLASQLSLLARNAEKHADNPAFRSDMLLTLRNSADKLHNLLARLGRYGAPGRERPRHHDLQDIIGKVAESHAGRHRVTVLNRVRCAVVAERDGLEQALLHLLQNAIDASPPDRPVFLDARLESDRALIEVIDSGCGMSAEFVRTHLFKPFHSSKQGGFGIGAFEARELIRAMGGTLSVESREGLGTRFLVSLRLADVKTERAA